MINLKNQFKFLLTRISPKLNTKFLYFVNFKRPINLKNPETFNEKIQWLKFNTYKGDPLVTQCADKYLVRDYVQKCGCSEILNEVYQVCDNADEIIWDRLPDKFVAKWNFGCGQNMIVNDKSKLDISKSVKQLNQWKQEHKFQWMKTAELHYKNIVPKLLCERFIETDNGTLPVDYKVYCYGGEARYVMMCLERETGHPKFVYVDRNMSTYNFEGTSYDVKIEKPVVWDELFYYAEKLSKPFPFVRADFYIENGKVIFGELTFTPAGGLDYSLTHDGDLKLGAGIELKSK